MGENKAVSEKELKSLASMAAKNALKQVDEASVDFIGDDEFEDLEEAEDSEPLEDDEVDAECLRHDAKDVFVDVGEVYFKRSNILLYQIIKDGMTVSNKVHPYSWAKIHEDFGPGSYKVVSRCGNTKRFVKGGTQTRVFGADPTLQNANKVEERISHDNEITHKILETFDVRNRNESERRDRERKEEMQRLRTEQKDREDQIRNDAKERNSLMETLITAMMSKNESNPAMEMLLAQMKNNDDSKLDSLKTEMQNGQSQMTQVLTVLMAKMSETPKDTSSPVLEVMMKMEEQRQQRDREDRRDREEKEREERRERQRLDEKRDEQMKDLFTNITSMISEKEGDKTKDPFEILRLANEYEDKGYQKHKDLLEIAETKARQIKDDEGESSNSMALQLVKNLGPVAQAFLAAKQNAPVITPEVAALYGQNVPSQTEQLPPIEQNQHRTVKRPQNAQQRPVKTQKTQRSAVDQFRPTVNANPNADAQQKKPLASSNKKDIMDKSKVNEKQAAQNEANKAKIEQAKIKTLELISPIVLSCLLKEDVETNYPQAAQASLTYLLDNHIPPQVVRFFTADEIIAFSASQGISEKEYNGVEKWLRRYYDSLSEQANALIRQINEKQAGKTS